MGWGWARGSDDGTEPGMGDEMPALATDGVGGGPEGLMMVQSLEWEMRCLH